jgi:hypothetical protein
LVAYKKTIFGPGEAVSHFTISTFTARENIDGMIELHKELKDVSHALDEIHRDPNGTSTIGMWLLMLF